ncbi:hypothetical protein M433DRAFT_154059 [Acidomyces richmondensis BFW]|nr:MAG: hypothetical protein FE78DRAFT_89934 [Acidomyces sp. 'richmondensis']KYG45880.1 hypothetical protein M433DRAFT_154059 [Acidomyces richmondensis BFW]
MFPDLEETSQFLLNIFEGAHNNHDAMSQYLRGADVIFQCIATNIAKPGHPFAITQQDASSAFSKSM